LLAISLNSSTKKRKKTEVCHYWLMRNCKSGESCPFLHEGEQIRYSEVCRFYRGGAAYCLKGDECPYSHGMKVAIGFLFIRLVFFYFFSHD
jgi:hypothetical protein